MRTISKLLAATGGAVAAMALMPSAASAQMMQPMGEELYNQSVQVRFADGTTNTVSFMENGDATIRAPGVDPVPAQWRVVNNQLCLYAQGDQECWGYTNRFTAGTPMTLSSTCNVTSQWLASSVNPMTRPAPAPMPAPAPAPVQRPMPMPSGERG